MAEAHLPRRARRLLWFLALWAAGVLAIGALTLALRALFAALT